MWLKTSVQLSVVKDYLCNSCLHENHDLQNTFGTLIHVISHEVVMIGSQPGDPQAYHKWIDT